MSTRKQFIGQGGVGFLSLLLPRLPATTTDDPSFEGLIVNDLEGEAVSLRDGTSIVRINIAKSQGAESICFLSESFRPGDALPVHKHSNEDELIFIHKGSGLFALGEKEYPITEGAVVLVPKIYGTDFKIMAQLTLKCAWHIRLQGSRVFSGK